MNLLNISSMIMFVFLKLNIIHHVILAFVLRCGFLFYGIYHDKNYLVKYTDVDYVIFTDAARYLYSGSSPFERETYRYPPVLALLLCPNIFLHESFGKLLFILFDILTAFLIYKILCTYNVDIKTSLLCACFWFYNPMCATICTRGSCDAIMTALTLLCIHLFQTERIKLFSLIYGITVHFRLYPCIYAFTFYIALSDVYKCKNWVSKLKVILQLTRNKCAFILFSAVGFFVPSLISFYFCDIKYINEAFLYHVARKDIKHNFSPYFYFLYLSENSDSVTNIFSLLPFIFQILLLFFSAYVFSSKYSLPCCLFIQTCIFVTFNKVCTSQYFLWYLCLFPLVIPLLALKYSVFLILFLWFGSQILWLIPAYYLEHEGANTFLFIWSNSLVMFSVYIYLFYLFCKNCPLSGYEIYLKKCKKVF